MNYESRTGGAPRERESGAGGGQARESLDRINGIYEADQDDNSKVISPATVHVRGRHGAGLTGRGGFLAVGYLGRRSADSLQPRLSNSGPSARRPECFGGLKARNLIAWGEAPGYLPPLFSAAL
jgi:hypothetical protein